MNWERFGYGIWHPFGPYTGLTVPEILDWKRGETERHGWTFWSFANSDAMGPWLRELDGHDGPVYALCSASPGARDPDKHRGERMATHYRLPGEAAWHAMPDPRQMKVTNPFKRQGRALAFKVARVIELDPHEPPIAIEWYARTQGQWRSDSLPTRGEYLVRQGGSGRLRRVCAVLELVPPYLAELKHEPDGGAA